MIETKKNFFIHEPSGSTLQIPQGIKYSRNFPLNFCKKTSFANYCQKVKNNQDIRDLALYVYSSVKQSEQTVEEEENGRFIHRKYLPTYPSNILDIEEIIYDKRTCATCGEEIRGAKNKRFCGYVCRYKQDCARQARRKLDVVA